MAIKATIYKATVQLSDLDRQVYAEQSATIARHPSETDERMMVRILSFALHASDTLSFGKGLSAEDEPDLAEKDLTGAIETWIEIGQPDDKRIRRACGRARQVYVYCYGGHGSKLWWEQIADKLERTRNLTVKAIEQTSSKSLALLAARNMQLHCTIQDEQVWLADSTATVEIVMETIRIPAEARY